MSMIHQKGIIHRDIKLENILLINKSVLQIGIIDFGFAICKNEVEACIKCGTPGYCAPESLIDARYSEKSDIFSIGCILYNMLAGEYLFNGKNMKEICLNN